MYVEQLFVFVYIEVVCDQEGGDVEFGVGVEVDQDCCQQ